MPEIVLHGPKLLRMLLWYFSCAIKNITTCRSSLQRKGAFFGSTSLSFQWSNLIYLAASEKKNTSHTSQIAWKIEKQFSILRGFTHRQSPTALHRRAVSRAELRVCSIAPAMLVHRTPQQVSIGANSSLGALSGLVGSTAHLSFGNTKKGLSPDRFNTVFS